MTTLSATPEAANQFYLTQKKKPPPEETAFSALERIGEQGRILMQAMSVRSCSPPAKGGEIFPREVSCLLRELPLNRCLRMPGM